MTLYEDIGKAMKQLLFDDPYYALFLLGIQKQETTAVPTLAVGLTGLILHYILFHHQYRQLFG